jgi:hypothetical protein
MFLPYMAADTVYDNPRSVADLHAVPALFMCRWEW